MRTVLLLKFLRLDLRLVGQVALLLTLLGAIYTAPLAAGVGPPAGTQILPLETRHPHAEIHPPRDHAGHEHRPRAVLILDLAGDRITPASKTYTARFDLEGDGQAEETVWIGFSPDDGFLCLDSNGNGQIDDGRELFGAATTLPSGERPDNGFAALAFYDRGEQGGNEDGEISAADAIWTRLRVWVDSDRDGVSAPDELKTMPAAQVTVIPLEYTESTFIDGSASWHWLVGDYRRVVHHRGKELTLYLPIEAIYLPEKGQLEHPRDDIR